jgi:hypothetical protein
MDMISTIDGAQDLYSTTSCTPVVPRYFFLCVAVEASGVLCQGGAA